MAESARINVSGITPVAEGDNWFVIDESGGFSVDRSINATVYLVGGGCDGGEGDWIGYDAVQDSDGYWSKVEGTGTGTSYAGDGGDGGYVFTASGVKIGKQQNCTAVIAENNDKSGTSLIVNGVTYKCDSSGYIGRTGGKGGGVKLSTEIIQPTNGQNGVTTPFQVVGSSGGGGLSCNGFNVTPDDGNVSKIGEGGEGAGSTIEHHSPGTDAVNYGCGGGGGAICGQIGEGQFGGKGKQGCIIVVYSEETDEPKNLVVVRHYKKTCITRRTCNTAYSSASKRTNCCSVENTTPAEKNTSGNSEFDFRPPSVAPSFGGNTGASETVYIRSASGVEDIEKENAEMETEISMLQEKLNKLKAERG